MSNNLSELALAEIFAGNDDLARRNQGNPSLRALNAQTGTVIPSEPEKSLRANLVSRDVGSGKRKYRNEPMIIDNQRFDSKKEGRRYAELVLLAKAGEITDLECHPKYEFVHNGIKIGSFRPDFRYRDRAGQLIIEDTKSPSTKKETAYRIRRLLLLAFYGLEVREV